MNRREMKRSIKKVRRSIDRIGASLDNALVFANEKRGQETVLRLLRQCHEEMMLAGILVSDAFHVSQVHSIPADVVSTLEELGHLGTDKTMSDLVRMVLTRGQSGHSVQTTAHVLGVSQGRLCTAMNKSGLKGPGQLSLTSRFLTAVAKLSEGGQPDTVAHSCGYSNSLTLSTFLHNHGGMRIKDARVIEDFPALLRSQARELILEA